jgi:hypothetical protein
MSENGFRLEFHFFPDGHWENFGLTPFWFFSRFLSLCKDADPDVVFLINVRKEYAALHGADDVPIKSTRSLTVAADAIRETVDCFACV